MKQIIHHFPKGVYKTYRQALTLGDQLCGVNVRSVDNLILEILFMHFACSTDVEVKNTPSQPIEPLSR